MDIINQLSQFAAQVAPFAIVGVIATGVIQWFKQFATKLGHVVLIMVGVSIVLGAAAYFLGTLPPNILTDIVGVLGASNLIFLLLVKLTGINPGTPTQTSTPGQPTPPAQQ